MPKKEFEAKLGLGSLDGILVFSNEVRITINDGQVEVKELPIKNTNVQ